MKRMLNRPIVVVLLACALGVGLKAFVLSGRAPASRQEVVSMLSDENQQTAEVVRLPIQTASPVDTASSKMKEEELAALCCCDDGQYLKERFEVQSAGVDADCCRKERKAERVATY